MSQPPYEPGTPPTPEDPLVKPPPQSPYGQQPPSPSPQEPPPYGQPAGYGEAGGYAAAPPPTTEYGYGAQPPMPPGMYYDPNSQLALPNGVELCSIGRRIGCWFLGILLMIVTLFVGWLIWGLIVWGRGQTPAMQVLKMRSWRPETGSNAHWGYMALREVVGRIAEGIFGIITSLLSFILMLATAQRKCLKDYIAGTVILYDPNDVLAPPPIE